MSDHYCTECGEPCEIKWLVEYEPFEFWGQKGTQHFEGWVSECCEAEVEGNLPDPPSYDYEPDYSDMNDGAEGSVDPGLQ